MVERNIFAIDVGTTKICCLIGQNVDDGPMRIIGVGVAPSSGLQKGTVVDVEAATNSIRAAVKEAERVSGMPFNRAYVGISGTHIAGVNSRGAAVVSRATRGVGQEDIERALEAAQTIAIPYSHEILHAIPRGYTLDGQDSIRNPIGMFGQKLEVEAHLVTAASASVNNLVKCVRGAGVEVESVVLEALASGEAVLTAEERESGVVLVDIGGGTTDVGVFLNGSVWHSSVIGIGGQLVTNDLVICLQMPFASAEDLKLRCGCADASDVPEREMLDIIGFGDQPRRTISRHLLAEIIEARIEQIFTHVAKEIKRSGYSGLLPAGVVLCGGTAQLGGIRAVGKRVLGMPIRFGTPGGLRGLLDVVSNPAHAAGVGLLNWGLAYGQGERKNSRPAGEGSGWLREVLSRILPG